MRRVKRVTVLVAPLVIVEAFALDSRFVVSVPVNDVHNELLFDSNTGRLHSTL